MYNASRDALSPSLKLNRRSCGSDARETEDADMTCEPARSKLALVVREMPPRPVTTVTSAKLTRQTCTSVVDSFNVRAHGVPLPEDKSARSPKC